MTRLLPIATRWPLQRGPLVYCAEWKDSPDQHVRNIVLSDSTNLTAQYEPTLLKGVEVIQGKAVAYRKTADGDLKYSEESFKAIPYYAWANRSPGQMEVWIATPLAARIQRRRPHWPHKAK